MIRVLMLQLIVAKRYSSCPSPWVALKATGEPFIEEVIALDLPDSSERIRRVNPPAASPYDRRRSGGLGLALAICSAWPERLPNAGLWPADPSAEPWPAPSAPRCTPASFRCATRLPMRIYPRRSPCPPAPRRTSQERHRPHHQPVRRFAAAIRTWDLIYSDASASRMHSSPRSSSVASPPTASRLPAPAAEYAATLAEHPAVRAWVHDAHNETLRAPRHGSRTRARIAARFVVPCRAHGPLLTFIPAVAPSRPGLQRTLRLRDLILYGVIVIQPVAPMSPFGAIQSDSRGHAVTAILLAMFAMLLTALSYGRMAAAIPSAGSAFAYVGRTLHPGLGFVTGWACCSTTC